MVRLLQDVESLPPAGVALLLVVLLLLEIGRASCRERV